MEGQAVEFTDLRCSAVGVLVLEDELEELLHDIGDDLAILELDPHSCLGNIVVLA